MVGMMVSRRFYSTLKRGMSFGNFHGFSKKLKDDVPASSLHSTRTIIMSLLDKISGLNLTNKILDPNLKVKAGQESKYFFFLKRKAEILRDKLNMESYSEFEILGENAP